MAGRSVTPRPPPRKPPATSVRRCRHHPLLPTVPGHGISRCHLQRGAHRRCGRTTAPERSDAWCHCRSPSHLAPSSTLAQLSSSPRGSPLFQDTASLDATCSGVSSEVRANSSGPDAFTVTLPSSPYTLRVPAPSRSRGTVNIIPRTGSGRVCDDLPYDAANHNASLQYGGGGAAGGAGRARAHFTSRQTAAPRAGNPRRPR